MIFRIHKQWRGAAETVKSTVMILKTKESIYCNTLGKSVVKRIYTHSDVLHCEVIDSVAEEFIKLILTPGDYNGIARMNALDWLRGD